MLTHVKLNLRLLNWVRLERKEQYNHVKCISSYEKTYSVISESTFSQVCSSFRAFGGFEVEVMVDITHSKPTLE